jgi:hypothetical protein
VIKRSKSKEGTSSSSNNAGGISQRNQAEEMKFSQTMNIQDQKGSTHQRNN